MNSVSKQSWCRWTHCQRLPCNGFTYEPWQTQTISNHYMMALWRPSDCRLLRHHPWFSWAPLSKHPWKQDALNRNKLRIPAMLRSQCKLTTLKWIQHNIGFKWGSAISARVSADKVGHSDARNWVARKGWCLSWYWHLIKVISSDQERFQRIQST